MENSGRSGRGKKGKKKATTAAPLSVPAQAMPTRVKALTPSQAAEEGLKSTKRGQDQLLVKTKRKRLKKTIEGASSMLEEVKMVESGLLKTKGRQVHDQVRHKALHADATMTCNETVLKETVKKKRKRVNETLEASTGTSDSDRVMTTMALKKGTSNDGKQSLLTVTQLRKKKEKMRSQLPSTAVVTKQTVVGVLSPRDCSVAQLGNVATKLLTQRTRKSERVATTVDVSAAMASPCKKVEAVRVSARSTSMLSKDESQLVVKKLKPKVQQSTCEADASKQMDRSVNQTLMLQQVPQADAAITAKRKDEATLASCPNVTRAKEATDFDPSTAAFDDKTTTSRPVPDTSTRDPAISLKPSHTVSAAASLNTGYGKPVLQEPMPGEVTSPLTKIAETTSALVASAVSPQLTIVRLATTATARSEVTGGHHKRRRSIDQAATHFITDPSQPLEKRSTGSSNGATFQLKANGLNDAQSPADGVHATLDQLLNSPRHHAVPEAANNPVTVQKMHESAIEVVGGQATPTVKVTATLFQSEAEKPTITELVNVRRCATQPMASMTPVKPSPAHETSPVQTQARRSNDFQPSATRLEAAVKTEITASSTAPRQGEGVGLQYIATSFESAATNEVGIVTDSRTYVQKMMSTDTKTSSHCNSSLKQSVQSMTSLPPRPQNTWGASFGMVPPPSGAASVSRTLSTTPLSSWFLSKGCANFVKQVQFSEEATGNSSEEDVPLTRQSSTLHGADKAPIKRSGSATKKNAFLESLTTQSYWRTWYGTVDLHDLIDPPLVYVPDKLRNHEITPLSLPGPSTESDSNASVQRNDLESLEADIRQEKQRGSAFSKQLLMMLQGKTVSGKSLEEEYRPLLR